MGSSIRFTPLCGTQPDSPLCHLLEIDGFSFLLDCGWDDKFQVEQLEAVKRVIPSIDAVLISHPDPSHFGGLPYLVGRCGLTAPIYTTLPVRKMGEMFMFDLYLAKKAISEFDTYDLNDVDVTFGSSKWVQLRYFQHYELQGKGAGITITPFNAGRFVGGSIWKISKGGEDIVYAIDYNHKKERHLNKTDVQELFSRPSLIITSALSALAPMTDSACRDNELIEVILATVRGDGNVLLPVDSAGRTLELALLLDDYWARQKMVYPLVFLSELAPTTMDFAKMQLEWMSDQIGKAFETKRNNPFNFRFLRLMTSTEQLNQLPAGPKVVLASAPSLECGFARQLFAEWAGDEKNTVCFVMRGQDGTLAAQVQKHVAGLEQLQLQLQLGRRVPLQGAELEEYELQKALEQEPAAAGVGSLGQPGQLQGASGAPAGQFPVRASGDSIAKVAKDGVLVGQKSAGLDQGTHPGLHPQVLMDGFTPPQGVRFPMFPDEDEPLHESWDDYGAVLRSDEVSQHPALGTTASMRLTDMEIDVAMHQGEAEEAEEVEEVPTKLVVETVDLTVRAAVRFFDYEGRADGKVLKQVLQDLAPRQVVLVQGSQAARQELRQHCERELRDFKTCVYTPGVNETVDVSLATSHMLYFSDELYAHARLQRMDKYAAAFIHSSVGPPDMHLPSLLQLLPPKDEDVEEDVFVLDGASGVKLTDVKKALADAGLESAFQGPGCLVCGAVMISKGSDKAHLVLEGSLCDDYYRVREIIYSQYSVC